MPALSPTEIVVSKEKSIPEPVFAAFNELLAENVRDGRASIKLNAAAERIVAKMKEAGTSCTRTEVFKNGWLDVEPAYRRAGWAVNFEVPDMYEDFEPYYVFKA